MPKLGTNSLRSLDQSGIKEPASPTASTWGRASNYGLKKERKANFKANAAAMKAINAALGGGDFDAAITQATTIADWARVMPDYFPENSDMGDTKARPDIWTDFDDFKIRASANEKAALKLISTAKTGDASATIGALKQLGGTCKSCHENFKY